MNKTEYILRSLAKVSNKRWELFVVSHIIHQIDEDIEFVAQQLVRGGDGQRYLTDLYFPQFGVHLEIDEGHHIKNIQSDKFRELDIVHVTNHQVKRIKIFDEFGAEKLLTQIRAEIENFIDFIKRLKKKMIASGRFFPWDWDSRYSADPIINRGYLDISDNVTFRLQAEALRCFGFSGQTIRRGTWRIRDGSRDWVWFPRLYPHYIWNNEISADGQKIRGYAINDLGRDKNIKTIDRLKKEISQGKPVENVIVFAKSKDNLGTNVLRYVGTFRVNLSESCADFTQFDQFRTIEKVRL